MRICRIKNINIYSDSNGHYIVHNTSKQFEYGHTHVNNYKTAKYLAYLIGHNRLPKGHISDYLRESLIRLAKDKKYIMKLENNRNEKRI